MNGNIHKIGIRVLVNREGYDIEKKIEQAKKDCVYSIVRTLTETGIIKFNEKEQGGDIVVESSLMIYDERTLEELNIERDKALANSKNPHDGIVDALLLAEYGRRKYQ